MRDRHRVAPAASIFRNASNFRDPRRPVPETRASRKPAFTEAHRRRENPFRSSNRAERIECFFTLRGEAYAKLPGRFE